MKHIWEKFNSAFSTYSADDDYDGNGYDDELNDGFVEEEPAPGFGSGRNKNGSRGSTDETAYTDTGSADSSTSVGGFATTAATGFNGHVVNGTASGKQQLVLVRPETFNDAPAIAANLRDKRAVVLNLDNVDKALARRVVDFLSGCTYAVDGSVKKVAHATYLFCPSNMEITGDLKNLAGETEAYV